MNPWIVFAIVLVIAIAILAFLYFKGSKLQKEQQEQKEKLYEAATQVSMLIIDKKRLPLKDSGLPQNVIEQAPKRARRAKIPVVKAKIGPRVMTLIADENVYDEIPIRAEVKAMLSGIYIVSIKNFRKAPVPKPEKKGLAAKLRKNADAAGQQMAEARKEKEKAKAKKKN
ncbi:MAG: hypothetical protein MR867_05105 [Eubacterium sp.]|nr:hypothetical protein [Eubacterium sp.]MDD7208936.1 hypothetical protein [Lachnospiraceae bacterium]MDY5496585.1 hypothetical protein [Anaerobutyricum sp.]